MKIKFPLTNRIFSGKKGGLLGLLLTIAFMNCAHITFAEPRRVQNLDCGWRLSLNDTVAAKEIAFDDSGWRMLDVPHDWSIEGDYSPTNKSGVLCGYLPSGIGWYRREIQMPADCKERNATLEFDGVYMNSEVWFNGERVGGRPYGYLGFTCDLTAHLKPGRNVLAVRVDNSREPSARWYHGCGIYGNVRLIASDLVHVAPSGIFVQTPLVTQDAAGVRADVEVKNASKSTAEIQVDMEILGADNQAQGFATTKKSVPAGETVTVTQELALKHPRLWSIESPSLYTLKTRVVRDGKTVDEVATPFGVRTLRFDAMTGFYLNDQPVKIKGVCEHQGGSPFGAAIPEAMMERRLKQLKAMGCNAIRVSHNPQLPYFYDLCDRMGFLVMDEIFDGWHEKADHDYGTYFFATEWKRDVTDWIRRDRNHPCVIFWSIGNETGKRDDHKITELIHSLDKTRPTTGGAVIYGVDVAGFNGGIVEKDAVLLDFHRDNPTVPIVMTEEPHSFQTRGFYRTVRTVFKDMDNLPNYAEPEVFTAGHTAYRSSYDNCGRRLVARNCWKRTLSRPWVMGEFRWTGFDYLGEAGWSGTQSLARAFNFGVIDLAGFPKDHYSFYQSIWTEAPMVHLLPHWTHPGLEGKVIPVVAYANAEEVELFQDGVSLGRKPRTDLFECVWQVPYKPGELKAVAYRGGKAVVETVQRTAGVPSRLHLTTDNATLKASRSDLALVSLAVRDEHGTLVPSADSHIGVALLGPARFLGCENGDPVDITPQHEPWRKAFGGLARAFYAGLDEKNGSVEVAALSVLGDSRFNGNATVTLACERVALRGPLSSLPFEIHYTLDGTEPALSSPRYTTPFSLQKTTTVRAALFCEGKLLTTSFASFTKGQVQGSELRALVTPGKDQGEAEDPSHEKRKKLSSGPATN
jgi:beta-galactosidase